MQDLSELIPTRIELVSDAVSIGAVTTPLWWPAVLHTSAELLPLLGALWLLMQMSFFTYRVYRYFGKFGIK